MLPGMKTAAARSFAPRVLTIDDYQPALESFSDELRWSGYVVKNVHSPHEAVLTAHSFLPDLMVADVALPSMDGVAAALEIKRWDPQCQVLLLSDSGVKAGEVRSVEASGFSFRLVRRPDDADEFIRQVGDLMGTRCLPSVS
jgi:CheY-like chemotaxis protein